MSTNGKKLYIAFLVVISLTIYDLVKDIVRKYKKLDPKSKKVLEDFCQDLMNK